MELWLFFKALTKHLWALMSCAVFTIIGVFAAATGKSNAWIVSTSLTAAVGLFAVACFLSWKDQYRGRAIAEKKLFDEQPRVMFGLLGQPDWREINTPGEYVFTLTNCGRRPATFVKVNPVSSPSESFTMYFDGVDVLPPDNHYRCIRHEVDDGKARLSLDKSMLWQFFHNCPVDDRTVQHFNVVVDYRDGSDYKQTVAKMDFDLDTKRVNILPHDSFTARG